MAVDFPTNPVDGSTYEYLNVVYVYVATSGADGYWAVRRPGQLSPATSGDLNEGTSNNKYATPLGLAGSKYVREDQVSGETVLNHSGTERLKTTAQGVETIGRLTLGGDTYKDGVKVGTTILWNGTAHDGTTMNLSQSIEDFDLIIINGNFSYSGNKGIGLASATMRPSQLISAGYASVNNVTGTSTSSEHAWLGVQYVSPLVLVGNHTIDGYYGDVNEVLGVKFP